METYGYISIIAMLCYGFLLLMFLTAKKNKIIKAAKKEFERVPFEQTSIKNIVEDAEIARGSFYQYFESKEDLLRVYFKYPF